MRVAESLSLEEEISLKPNGLPFSTMKKDNTRAKLEILLGNKKGTLLHYAEFQGNSHGNFGNSGATLPTPAPFGRN